MRVVGEDGRKKCGGEGRRFWEERKSGAQRAEDDSRPPRSILPSPLSNHHGIALREIDNIHVGPFVSPSFSLCFRVSFPLSSSVFQIQNKLKENKTQAKRAIECTTAPSRLWFSSYKRSISFPAAVRARQNFVAFDIRLVSQSSK